MKEEGKMEQHFEPLFGVEVKQFSGRIDFVQTITIKPNLKTAVNGTINYMTCDDEHCLPPKTIKFSVPIK